MESFHDHLRASADRLHGHGDVSLRQLAQLLGKGSQGFMLVLLAIPCLLPIPGSGTAFSVGLAALAWIMWRHFPRLALPRRMARLRLSPTLARRVLLSLAWVVEQGARFLRPRMGWWVAPVHRYWLAPMVGLMALMIFLPIPFGNVLPAVALVLLGLAIVFADGLALWLAVAIASLALLVPAGAVLGVLAWLG